MSFLIAVGATLVASFALVPFGLVLARLFGLYLVVEERRCVVFELFGKVRAVIDTPGLHCPWLLLGALFDVLEIQQLMWAEGLVVQVIPKGADILAQMSAVGGVRR